MPRTTFHIQMLLNIYSYSTGQNITFFPKTRLLTIRLHCLTTRIHGWLTVRDPDFTLTRIHFFYSEFRAWHRFPASPLSVEDDVVHHLSQQALYADPVASPSPSFAREIRVQVLSPPTTTPYRCNLSSETIQMTLDAALTRTRIVLRYRMRRASRSLTGF